MRVEQTPPPFARARLRKSALFPDARHTTPLDARMRASAPLDASATPSTTRARSLAPSTAPHRPSRARVPARVSRPPPPRASSRDVRDTDSRVPSLGRAVNDADKWHVYCSLGAKHSQHDDVQTLPRVWTSLDFGCQKCARVQCVGPGELVIRAQKPAPR